MRLLFLAFILLHALSGTAQKASRTPNPKKYAESITEADLRTHLFIIAGAEMEGRETATEGQRRAAAYIEDAFRKYGLKPGNQDSYQQAFPVYRDSLLSARIMVNNQEFPLNRDFQPLLQMSQTSAQYFSEVVLAGHGIVDEGHNDYEGLDVKGKAILILDGAPAGYKTKLRGWQAPSNTYRKILNANNLGASAVLVVAQGYPRKEMASLGAMYNELYSPQQGANVFTISPSLAEAILGSPGKQIIDSAKNQKINARPVRANVALELNKQVKWLESTNVLGYVEGSDKSDEWLIVTAHYDHEGIRDGKIYYGADDDGSGTVAILEIAEAFAKAKAEGKGPRRNVMIMAVSGEEKGLWGSEFYSDNPTVPLEKTTANLNIDMIGRIDTERNLPDTLNYVYVVGDDKLSTDLKPISEGANKKFTRLNLDYKFNAPDDPNRIYFRSDHYNFARKGIPVIFYYDGMLKADYHKPTDTPDKINYPLLRKRAQLVFHTAWEMANRNEMIKRDLELPTGSR